MGPDEPEQVDLTISGASVLDGTGAPPFVGSVDVVADRIVAVRPGLPGDADADGRPSAQLTIDGTGLTLAPGFIDVHCHDDWVVLTDPDHDCKTLQGVTTVVNGNCGTSPAPGGDSVPGVSTYARFSEYFDALDEARPAVNVASQVGHGAVRSAVMGLRTDRAPDADERAAMARHVEEALADGVVGLSSGLAYEPGRYSDRDEMIELTRLVATAGAVYSTHMRNESDGLIDSIEESIAVAEASGARLQISHLKAAGENNWGRVTEALRLIGEARTRGIDVMADQYPYTRGSTLLEQLVRGGALDGAGGFGSLTPDQVSIAAAPHHPEWEGRTLTEIAADEGIEPRLMADRMVEQEGRACIAVIAVMSEDDVRTVISSDLVMIGSDGVPLGEKAHPRLRHTFPRVLGRYVREHGLVDLATAVHRMTGMSAERFGLVDRGVVRAGALADLVLFDADTIADTGTYAEPNSVPDGIDGVWVNGERVVDRGAITGARPGTVIRRGHEHVPRRAAGVG